jgi:flagellar hook-basal body complex protein FliE
MAINPISPSVISPSLGVESAAPSTDSSATSATSGSGDGFAGLLKNAIGQLNQDTTGADAQVQALATGQSGDISGVVGQMEQTSLELDLASQVRSKLVDAYQEIFRMQV